MTGKEFGEWWEENLLDPTCTILATLLCAGIIIAILVGASIGIKVLVESML